MEIRENFQAEQRQNVARAELLKQNQELERKVAAQEAEIKRIKELLSTFHSLLPDLWLRLLPGVTVATHHAHTQTGQHDSKFGMTREEIMQAAELCARNGLQLTGLHFHQGSNFRDPSPLLAAIGLGLDISREIGLAGEWHFSPGGGWGVAYHESELPHPNVGRYVDLIAEAVKNGCQERGLDLPPLPLLPPPPDEIIFWAAVVIWIFAFVEPLSTG